jgi:hypothetical protein
MEIMAIETPEYQVLKKRNAYELRRYLPTIVAEVSVEGMDYRDAANRGFRPLASYIFGENTGTEKIAMTAPVTAESAPEKIPMTAPVTVSGENTYRVAFTMPSKYTMETLPKPKDPRITFRQLPERTMAVIRFSGAFNQRNFMKHLIKLQEWMMRSKLIAIGEPIIAGYDSPFVPWFLKHNEILIEIK